MLVIKRDGTREPFKTEKLLGGLIKACEKRPVSLETLEKAVDEISNSITASELKEIPTSSIGLKVMNHLQKIDQRQNSMPAGAADEIRFEGDESPPENRPGCLRSICFRVPPVPRCW